MMVKFQSMAYSLTAEDKARHRAARRRQEATGITELVTSREAFLAEAERGKAAAEAHRVKHAVAE